jgi:hypothetical protein
MVKTALNGIKKNKVSDDGVTESALGNFYIFNLIGVIKKLRHKLSCDMINFT